MSSSFAYYPTGMTYKTSEWAKLGQPYQLIINRKNGWIHQERPIPFFKLRPELGWTKSREPENHLNIITSVISSSIKENFPNVLCFSYKDHSLAARLNLDYCITLFDDSFSLSGVMYEDFPESKSILDLFHQSTTYDLIICRHYLEHVHNLQPMLCDLLELIDHHGYIYIEVPDCSIFLSQNNPLMLWEQHRHFFTFEELEHIVRLCGLSIEYTFVTECIIEPSICLLLKRSSNPKPKRTPKSLLIHSATELPSFCSYIEKAYDLITSLDGETVLYGAGHNSDRFLQWTKTYYQFSAIYDAKQTNNGRYLYGTNIPITTDIEVLAECSNIVLGTHPRDKPQVINSIFQINPQANIVDIFTL